MNHYCWSLSLYYPGYDPYHEALLLVIIPLISHDHPIIAGVDPINIPLSSQCPNIAAYYPIYHPTIAGYFPIIAG